MGSNSVEGVCCVGEGRGVDICAGWESLATRGVVRGMNRVRCECVGRRGRQVGGRQAGWSVFVAVVWREGGGRAKARSREYVMKEVGRSRVWSVTSKSHHTCPQTNPHSPSHARATINKHHHRHVPGISAHSRLVPDT